MKYSEFKQQQKDIIRPEPGSNTPYQISTLEDYLYWRNQCDIFEGKDISGSLTADDYKAFEANLQKIIDNFHWKCKDEVDDESYFEQVERHMQATDWAWGGIAPGEKHKSPTPKDMEECIRGLFYSCLESGFVQAYSATGGFYVSTDIYKHKVEVKFEVIEATADDSLDDVW